MLTEAAAVSLVSALTIWASGTTRRSSRWPASPASFVRKAAMPEFSWPTPDARPRLTPRSKVVAAWNSPTVAGSRWLLLPSRLHLITIPLAP